MNAYSGPRPDPDPDPDLALDLGAYFDGELDVEGRSRVESALEASPALRTLLSDMVAVRDLLVALPRLDADRDLSAGVLADVASERAARTRSRSGAAVAAMAALAMAAGVMLAVRLTRPPAPADVRPLVQTLPPHPQRLLPDPDPRPVPPPRIGRPSPSILPAEIAVRPQILAEEQKNRADRDRLQGFMTRGDVHQITLVVDVFGPSTLATLEDVIRESNRREPEHARIRLVQDVAPSPDGTGGEVVYALAMDEVENDRFQSRLKSEFPGVRIETAPPDPLALASLDQAARIEIRPGVPRSTLIVPANELETSPAIRRSDANVAEVRVIGPGADPAEPPRAEALPPLEAPKAKGSKTSLLPISGDPPIAVYLVWVRERAPAKG